MALNGRVPKPPEQVRHRHPSSTAHVWKEVPNVKYEGESPDLPERFSGRPYPPATLRWWGVIRRMPHCVLWEDSDWEFALGVAELHASINERDISRSASLIANYRTAENKLGITLSSRLSLRIKYVDAVSKEPLPDNVAKLYDYTELYGEK